MRPRTRSRTLLYRDCGLSDLPHCWSQLAIQTSIHNRIRISLLRAIDLSRELISVFCRSYSDSKIILLGMSARLQRAQYPFQQKTIKNLLRTISDLRSNLSLATNTLQLEVSITSLERLNGVNAGVKKLNDNSEASRTQILDSISEVHLRQKQQTLRVLDSEECDVLNWLSPLEFFSKHNDALNRRQEGTGRWVLECSEFRSWLRTTGKVIWCPGIREQYITI